MSQISASSSKSQHSNIFSLSSNKSQRQIESDQLQEFKQKLCKLLNKNTSNSLSDLYQTIQQKVTNRFFQDKIIEFDQMLNSLGSIKKNNRQMTKLISILGLKVQNKKQQKDKIHHNQNLRFKQTDFLQKQETNPTQTSEQYYNFKHKPIRTIFSPFSDIQNEIPYQKINQVEQSNQSKKIKEQRTKSFYEVYEQKNSSYENKIKNMLDELSNIKKQLHKTGNKLVKKDQQHIQNQNTINDKKQNIQKKRQEQQLKKYSYQQNKSPQGQNKQRIKNNNLKLNESLQKTNNKNNELLEYARNISLKLEQIKMQTNRYRQKDENHLNYQINKKHMHQLNEENTSINNSINQRNIQHFNNQQQERQNNSLNNNFKQQNHTKQLQNQYNNHLNNQQNTQNNLQYSSQEQFSIKNQNQPKIIHHIAKKKSILDDMKNVQSKVLISDKNIPQSVNHKFINSFQKSQQEGTMIDMVNQAHFNDNKPFHQNLVNNNLVNTNLVRNSLSDAGSQSSSRQVVISYLTMQQQPSNNKKWQQNSSFGQLKNTSNSYDTTFNQRSSDFNQSQVTRKNSIHKINPVANNFSNSPSNFHNTSIMNARGPMILKDNIQNSSVIRVSNILPNHQSPIQTRNSISTNRIQSNSQIISYPVQNMKGTNVQNHRIPVNIQNQSAKRLSLHQPLIYSASSSNNLPINHQKYQITPIKPILRQNNQLNTPQLQKNDLNLIRTNQPILQNNRISLNHSISEIAINMNNFQNRFKNQQNKSSYSQQKQKNRNSLNNTSYLSRQNTSNIQSTLPYNLNFFYLDTNKKSITSQNNKSVKLGGNFQRKTLKNPFQQLNQQFQSDKKTIRPMNKRQSALGRYSSAGINTSFVNSKVQPFVTLGNSSKISKDSRDSRYSKDSKGSRKSKGLQLFSQIA